MTNILQKKTIILLIVTFIALIAIVLFKGYSVGQASDGHEDLPQKMTVSRFDSLINLKKEEHNLDSGSSVKVWTDGETRQASLNELTGFVDISKLTQENIQPDASVFEVVTLKNNNPALYIEFNEPDGKLIKSVHWSLPNQGSRDVGSNFIMYFTEGFSKEEALSIVSGAHYDLAATDRATLTDQERQSLEKKPHDHDDRLQSETK